MTWRSVAESLGWEVRRASLYDEEGVEGWRWESPDGQQWANIGPWDQEPEPPEEVLRLLMETPPSP